MYLYPLCVLDDAILWQVIDDAGKEHWEQMVPTNVDPEPLAKQVVDGITKCAACDERVIAAQLKALQL